MTSQDHSSHADQIVATYQSGEAARRASMAIESLGIDSSRVKVDSRGDVTSDIAESHMDTATITRPRHLAAQGIVVGAVIGAAIGLVLGLVSDVVPFWAFIALLTIPGVILGALFGVFTRLSTNPEIVDSYAGGPVKLTVDLTALDDAEREAAVEKLRAEQPIRLAES